MGIRIHKVIGWGMPADVFEQNVAFEIEDDDFEETLSDKLGAITRMIIPEKSVGKIFEDWRGFIAEPNLMVTSFRFNEEPAGVLTSANDLHFSVQNYDEPPEVHLFLPSGLYANLHRRDDTLDYVEATHDLSTGDFSDNPTPFVLTELQHNPYPWSDNFMDSDGRPVAAPMGRFDRKPGVVPRPPAELRWWLTEMGIIQPDAWKLLRPYYASWWS